jgi:hypothetical protein
MQTVGAHFFGRLAGFSAFSPLLFFPGSSAFFVWKLIPVFFSRSYNASNPRP